MHSASIYVESTKYKLRLKYKDQNELLVGPALATPHTSTVHAYNRQVYSCREMIRGLCLSIFRSKSGFAAENSKDLVIYCSSCERFFLRFGGSTRKVAV